jgi:hypothetical protein
MEQPKEKISTGDFTYEGKKVHYEEFADKEDAILKVEFDGFLYEYIRNRKLTFLNDFIHNVISQRKYEE